MFLWMLCLFLFFYDLLYLLIKNGYIIWRIWSNLGASLIIKFVICSARRKTHIISGNYNTKNIISNDNYKIINVSLISNTEKIFNTNNNIKSLKLK